MGDTKKNLFIGIVGLIGAGKTTLTKQLAQEMGLPDHYEAITENPYLESFYKDMGAHAFALQVHLLNCRFAQHQKIIWDGKGAVQDRTIYEDAIFAKMLMEAGHMSRLNYQTYLELFDNMSKFMSRPNVIVMLDVAPEVSLQRIRERGRACEAGITLEYLQKLHKGYDDFIKSISKVIPVIRVNWNVYVDADKMARYIREEYEKIQTVHTLAKE